MGGDKAARRDAITRAAAHSPYLAGLIARWPDYADLFTKAGADIAWTAIETQSFPDDLAAALRQERGLRWMVAALADLSGEWGFADIVPRLSDFADSAIDRALTQAFAERANWVGGGAAPAGFAVIALGKHGSRELNYSSDIDPILIFDPETMPRRDRDDPGEAAVRIGRRMVELLNARTADGFVFRVDLRLRPASEITPIVLPVNAAISHYESAALAWEQAAFIRARAAAGDTALGSYFLTSIQPFIWRRALDFGQIKAIGDVSRRIRDHYAAGQKFGAGYDVKRGRGGIREVEFYAQVHQLIHGGRDMSLRPPATLDAIAALAAADRLTAAAAKTLSAAYVRLRTVEHRLQMIGDQQTHSLPAMGDALDAIAQLDGLADGAALLDSLALHIAAVGALYDDLIAEEHDHINAPQDAQAMAAQAQKHGFADPDQAATLIAGWRTGQYRALRSPAALEAMEAALPQLLSALGQGPDPNAALAHLDRLLCAMPSALNLFALLKARPDVLGSLVSILSHAPTLAEALGRQPSLLDALIDSRVKADVPALDSVIQHMASSCMGKPYEMQLDAVRQIVGDHRFALGAQLIEGHADPLAVSRGYSDVAEAALTTLANATLAEFRAVHGQVPGSELIILALGRFGGRALTHASDLDLIYLFTGDFLAESNGPKPLGATLYYNRLAQRISAAMSVPTASGRLYDVDTRLRPSGADGPLVVSVDSFDRYQRENAWTWEHMALTRARVVYGSRFARLPVEETISTVLMQPRDSAKLISDAAQMRCDMAAHKPPTGPLDVKMGAGGLVDLEFAVHVTQLRHRTGFDANLDHAIRVLVGADLAPPAIYSAYQLLARLLVVLRLAAPSGIPATASQPVIAQMCGQADWDTLIAALEQAQAEVSDWWQSVQMIGE